MSARSYDVRVVALTLDLPVKWIDNLLSHHELPGCSRSRQGVERRIDDTGLVAIEVVRMLQQDLGIPLGRAAALVRSATGDGKIGALRTQSGILVNVSVDQIEKRLQARLIDALEAVPRVARGRPRASKR